MLDISLDMLLRIGCFGIFWGHGFLAATRAEFGSWKKFTRAGGFTEAEAQIVMPLIGCKDLLLAVITLLHPIPLLTAWMVAWATATALARPFSGGHIWGFVERAGNFICPLTLLRLQTSGGMDGAWQVEHALFDALERGLQISGWDWNTYVMFAAGAVVVLWGVLTPILRSRPVHKAHAA